MSKKSYELNYWKQYKLLEKEFANSLIYVELSQANFLTYSSVYLKLLLEIGSEVDNVLREMCAKTGRTDISTYASFVLAKYPNITSHAVQVKDGGFSIIPFNGWNTIQPSQSLSFWEAYNIVKHDRVSNYQEATMKNVLNALAGLFILEMYRMRELYDIDPDEDNSLPDDESDLFVLTSWEQHLRTSKARIPYALFDDEDGNRQIL